MADSRETPAGDAHAARVTSSGLAVVHAGELILPAAGSEAQAEQVANDDRAVVTYVFPVEVEVRGPAAVDTDELVELTLASLASGVRSLA